MKRNFESLHEALIEALQAEENQPNPMHGYLRSIGHIEKAISEMKEMVHSDPFPGKQEEMHHFKNQAPEIYSQLFYFMRLSGIESIRSYTGPDRFRFLLQQEMQSVDAFFQSHDAICRYCSTCSTYQDEHLFTRREYGEWSGAEIGAFIPNDFTIGSYWVAWIKANSRLRSWIKTELEKGGTEHEMIGGKIIRKLKWTGHRVNFIEVFTPLQLAGCFNDGKVTLKEVMEWGEAILEVKPGQYNVALTEMSLRKGSQTSFLDQLAGILRKKFASLLEKR
jgi:hypothetical protein